MRTPSVLALSLLLFLAGCTKIISDTSLDRADRSIRFSDLQRDPEAYRGKFVILGGAIMEIRQVKDGIQLEVIEYPLDNDDMPVTLHPPGGLFLVILPPDAGYAMFRPGMVVTIAGEVAGKADRQANKVEYTYPVLAVKEIHIIVHSSGGYYHGY
jgi:outer membrane lipoprotein